MWTLCPPTDRQLLAVRLRQSREPLSYPHVSSTNSTVPPSGYDGDHNRTTLGSGPEAFTAAKHALRRWAQFPPGWTVLDPPDAPIREGTVVTVSARAFGVWWVNACRVVRVIDEPTRFGYAYGTLPGHVETGEERFLVELTSDGVVWYDLLAHSRPRYWLTRLAYPLARRAQKRFARDSLAAMRQAISVRSPVAV